MFSKQQILEQLENLSAPKDGIVLVHTSLRSVGEVEGGGEGLLSMLMEYFTENGGLFCVPTHTAANDYYGKDITLDMSDVYNDLGAFSTIALKDGRGIRSENPVLSLVAFGDKKKVEEFIKDDAFITTPTAKESCYGKLATKNGYVLLVGVDHSKNTYLHSVAEMLNLPDRMGDTFHSMKVKRATGEIVEREMRMYHCEKTQDIALRFPKYGMAFRYHGCIKDGFLGNAPVQLCNAAKMKDVVELIFKNADGKDPLATEQAIPPAWYCNK